LTSAANKLRVLFVDDEAPIRDLVRLELPRFGHDVTICEDGKSALAEMEKNTFDAAIVDLRMPGLSGWDVIAHVKKVSPETEVIISTGHGSMEEAVQALRRGAFDFLSKPTRMAVIASVLQKVADKRALLNKTIALEKRLSAVEGGPNIVGDSQPMQRVKKLIERIAPTDSTVLILGETGTGKELVARRIHDLSLRAQAPFVAINCGALPENLVESELFGHRKGAFTGADQPRKGLLEVANGGTLFLDELGELDRSMQVKLLRFLESGEVRRVGENDAIIVDVRVVCATNRDLEQMVNKEEFREDLFFRVNTFEIHLPPLRERREDITSLARSLLARHLKRHDLPAELFTPAALEALKAHDWSGNVRELANAVEHAAIMADGMVIDLEHLPMTVLRKSTRRPKAPHFDPVLAEKPKTLREIEMEMIHAALERNHGDKPRTALELGIALKTLYNKLNQPTERAEAS
jgi:DNA-binding NtrC family response regulator